MLKTYSLLWIGLLVLAFGNAALRELVYKNNVSELSAHQISTLTGCILVFVYSYFVTRIWPINSYSDSFIIATIWVLLTMSFKTVMVLVFMKKDLSFLLDSYNIFKGQLWPVFLLWLGLLPFILKK